jgi:hypothetical protein
MGAFSSPESVNPWLVGGVDGAWVVGLGPAVGLGGGVLR